MRQFPRVFLLAGLLIALATVVSAQPSKGPPNALQGFSQNRGQPVEIDAATLEVRDKDKVATFAGDVHVKQGKPGLVRQTLGDEDCCRCTLVYLYERLVGLAFPADVHAFQEVDSFVPGVLGQGFHICLGEDDD